MTSINYTLHLAGSAHAHTGALPALSAATATEQPVSGSRFGESLRDSLHLMTHGAGIALPVAAALGGGVFAARVAHAAIAAGTTSHLSALRGGLAGVALVAAGALAWNFVKPSAVPVTKLPVTTHHRLAPGSEHARVMTFNIRYGLGPDYADYVPSIADMNSIAATIKREDPDIVLLQEVHDFGVDNAFTDQFAAVTKRLNPDAAVFAPAGRDAYGKSDGNAVLTFNGYSIDDARALNFAKQPGEQARGVADVEVVSPGGRHVRVMTTHLEGGHTGKTREYPSLNHILAAGRGMPTIVSGDWNARANDKNGVLESSTFGAVGLTDAFTAVGMKRGDARRSSYGGEGLDRIYTGGGVSVKEAHVVRQARPTSDHQPVIADVTL